MGHACDFLSMTSVIQNTKNTAGLFFCSSLGASYSVSDSGTLPCGLLRMGVILLSGHPFFEFGDLGKKATAKVIYTRLYQATFFEIQTISKNFICMIPLHPYKK